MPTITKYPNTITQTSGGNFKPFKDLNNLKNSSNTYAITNGRLSGKTGSNPRPSAISATDFRFNLPVGAKVTQVRIEYAQQKLDYQKGKYPAIGATTVTPLGTTMPFADNNNLRIGAVPQTKMTNTTKTYSGTMSETNGAYNSSKKATSKKYNLPTREQVNSSNFGVRITYPSNTNTYEGWMQLKYIRITVTYKNSEYSISLKDISTDEHYAGNPIGLNITLNNTNKTSYQNTVTITLPTGATYDSFTGEGSVNASGNTVTWTPNIKDVYSRQCTLNIIYGALGTYAISVADNLEASRNPQYEPETIEVTVGPTPTGYTNIDDFEYNQIVNAKNNTEYNLHLTIPETYQDTVTYMTLKPSVASQFYINGSWISVNADSETNIPVSYFDENYELNVPTKTNSSTLPTEAYIYYYIKDNPSLEPSFKVQLIPADADYPSVSVFQAVNEELNRLGDGKVYTASSFLQIVCELSDIDDFVDYYRNFRIGVYNDDISDYTTGNFAQYLFDKCHIWSGVMGVYNDYEQKTVEFTYNDDYDIYIILTGEFNTTNPTMFSLQFTEPRLYESGTDTANVYASLPIPIKNTITPDDYSTLNVSSLTKSNETVFYDFPVDEDYGTNNEIAIRGIVFTVEAQTETMLHCIATLVSPYGDVGQRSVIIRPDDTEISFGNEYDLWGFRPSELTNLKDWYIRLQFQNRYESDDENSTIQINNALINFYSVDVENTSAICTINGEDTRNYSMFITNLNFKEGLDTDTKFIDIDGSDINDAYRMNIKQKKIVLDFQVLGCDLAESTRQLHDLGRLFANERDELNKPIPKRIAFPEIYPGEYWEYIMEKPIDSEIYIADYVCKLELTIPAGTSWADTDTTTGNAGYYDGIARVNPVIVAVPVTETVDITETTSGQKFSILHPDFTSEKIIQIDCTNRIVRMKAYDGSLTLDEAITLDDTNSVDITSYVDFNSDWFILEPGEYNFETEGTAILQTVTYTKRG